VLRRDNAGHVLLVLLDQVQEAEEDAGALRRRCGRPCRPGSLRCLHGAVDFCGAGEGDAGGHLARGWIEDVAVAAARLGVHAGTADEVLQCFLLQCFRHVGRSREARNRNTVAGAIIAQAPGDRHLGLAVLDSGTRRGAPSALPSGANVGGCPLHVHLDLDVLDPEEARANGYAEPNGLRIDEMRAILAAICARFEVRAVAVAAYDHACDEGDCAAQAGLEFVRQLFAPQS